MATDVDESLPTYTAKASASEAPPSYQAPTLYTIVGRKTSPLLSPIQLKGHLALLKGFAELKEKVEALENPTKDPFPFLPAEPERKWSWFVGLAVERSVLFLWIKFLTY
jgi:hypothetical protein